MSDLLNVGLSFTTLLSDYYAMPKISVNLVVLFYLGRGEVLTHSLRVDISIKFINKSLILVIMCE